MKKPKQPSSEPSVAARRLMVRALLKSIGIRGYRDPKQVARLTGMLALPFVGQISDYAINRCTWSKGDERKLRSHVRSRLGLKIAHPPTP